MGGMRTSGDLVARMQMTRAMKIDAAKAYVAEKLGVGIRDLTDAAVMSEVREEYQLGTVYSAMGSAKGIEAKFNIANLLDIEINCLNRFKGNSVWQNSVLKLNLP